MDARAVGGLDRVPGPVDVAESGPAQRGDRRALDRLGDRLDAGEVAVARSGEPGLDHVDAELGQLNRDLELLPHRQRDAGRLLAVAQRGVEDDHPVAVGRRDAEIGLL